jgi:protein TonB
MVVVQSTASDAARKSHEAAEGPLFTQVEKEPQFPGGTAGWRKYLEANLPKKGFQGAPKGTHKVLVAFIVGTDGSISDIQPETNIGFGLEEEAVRLIKNGPKWIPAEQNGRKVRVLKLQPVTFVIP